MNISNTPKTDKREYSDILNKIKALSEAFTPEWNFNADDPDIGAAASMIGAKLLSETIEKFNKTPEKNLVEFFGKMGAKPLYAAPASGYLCFGLSGSENNVKGEFVEGGSVFNVSNAAGENAAFTLSEPIYAVNSRINDVICSDFEKDTIHVLYDPEKGEQCSFVTDCPADEDVQRHTLYLRTDYFEGNAEGMKFRLRFIPDNSDEASLNAFYGAVIRSGIFYSSEEGFSPCAKLIQKNGELMFEFDKEHAPASAEILGEEGQWFMIPFTGETSVNDASQMYIERVAFASFASGIKPDGVFDDMAELNSKALFPFGSAPLPYSSVYFSCNSVLCRKGSTVTFEFKNHYSRIPIKDDPTEENIDWKFIMKRSKFTKPKKYDIFIKNVVWEYFGGSGWMRLFEDDRYGDVFNGSNDGSTVRMSFVCPDDISEVILPSGPAYAIRARIETVENFLKTDGERIMPQMFLPVFSYKYDVLPEIGTAAAENSLKLKLHKFADGSLRAAEPLPDEGRCLSIAFSAAPDNANIRVLIAASRFNPASDKKYIWEYLTAGGWKALNCVDESKGLSETGLLTLGSNSGFARAEMFGREGFWIRLRFADREQFPEHSQFSAYLNCARAKNVVTRSEEYFNVDDDNGLDCNLSGSGVYTVEVMVDELSITSRAEADRMIRDGRASPRYDENGDLARLWVKWSEYSGGDIERTYELDRDTSRVSFGKHGAYIPPKSFGENVMISYTTCDGESGNIESGSEFSSDVNRGLISRIYNPMKMSGGEGKENLSRTIERSAVMLRLRSRITTAADIEAAVKETDRGVLRVKAFGGRNIYGEPEPGAVTVAVLFKDMEAFSEKSAGVKKLLNEHCGAVIRGGVQVIKPVNVICSVSASVIVRGSDEISRVQAKICKQIRDYFDIEKGNIDKRGWEIGQLPEKPMIYGIISAIPEVRKIESFELSMFTENGDELGHAELDRLRKQGMATAIVDNIIVTVNI